MNYAEWNQALVSYLLSGVPRGSKIYLSLDEDVLEIIGQSFSSSPLDGSFCEDFQAAIRSRVVLGERVNLVSLQGRDADGLPKCVAFLGICVLAAYQMANEDEISELNYFKRLRQILNLSGVRRPPGMESGSVAEEPLWKEWNRWLLEQGFQISARPGSGSKKYMNYPISQCLLRQADKDRLQILFANKQWKVGWDAQTLFTQMRCEAQGLSCHLQELVIDRRERYEAVAEAIHDVYQQWQAQGSPSAPCRVGRTWNRNLFAGLYRTEDPFFGQAQYYLYPKQQRGRQLGAIQVECENSPQTLREERPGWYLPIGNPLRMQDLERGVTYSITSEAELEQLILPARNFWVLIPDPENPDSGVYASWGLPELGMPFILLCKQELLQDIQRLHDERLLEWRGEPQPVGEGSNWVEFDWCMVTSQAWEGVFIKYRELKDALQPTARLSISLSGGLRVPSQRGWLEGYSPQVTVFGFSPIAQLQVTSLLDEQVILERSQQKTNQPFPLNLPGTGTYLVRATYAGKSAERLIKIVDWSSLSIAEPKVRESIRLNDEYCICGSIIQSKFPAI